jgi:hypothetical protein
MMADSNIEAGMAAGKPSADGSPDFSLTGKRRRILQPVLVIACGLAALYGYMWYTTSHYDLPRLKPYAGAQDDLFAQMKCLVDYTELGKVTPGVVCRFTKTYDRFWLQPKALDHCLTYSTDNAVAAFDSPKRIEFDFMCEGNDMRAVMPYVDGKYRLQEIGMTFKK